MQQSAARRRSRRLIFREELRPLAITASTDWLSMSSMVRKSLYADLRPRHWIECRAAFISSRLICSERLHLKALQCLHSHFDGSTEARGQQSGRNRLPVSSLMSDPRSSTRRRKRPCIVHFGLGLLQQAQGLIIHQTLKTLNLRLPSL